MNPPLPTPDADGVDQHRIYRVLDANLNRAGEGLRVLEEYARFVLDNPLLTDQWKQVRHELATFWRGDDLQQLLGARNVLGDVGTQITADDEYRRQDARAVADASQKRVEQSLRCLEEYAKPIWPQLAPRLERLRYTTYSVGRAMQLAQQTDDRLASANVYALIGTGDLKSTVSHCQALLQAGVRMLQLREKRLDDRQLLEVARELVAMTRPAQAMLIINDRPDIARLSGADGVHLGQEDLPITEVRSLLHGDAMIGVSTHNIEQAREAVLQGANYIGCGPTFASPTKTFTEFAGPEFLRQVAAEIRLPAYAIGGITGENVETVRAAGFSRIAVSSALGPDKDLPTAVSQLNSFLRA